MSTKRHHTLQGTPTAGLNTPIPRIQGTKTADTAPLLAALVNTFVESEADKFFASVTPSDYEQLVAALDALIEVVGEDKNHLLTPLMQFIGNLIEKCQEASALGLPGTEPFTSEGAGAAPSRTQRRGLESAYGEDKPEYALDKLISLKPDAEGPDEKWSSGAPSSARGLEAAFSDDEPEYTPDILTTLNPDYEPS